MEAQAAAASRETRLSRLPAFRWKLLLALILVLAAAPRLYLGVTQYVEYDGYWHVFIAQQDNWNNFVFEYKSNAHPPLYFLVLKLALAFGRSPLIYRSVSLLAGLAAVFLVWKILRKASRLRATPAIGALAFGLAMPGIIISCEVRSYMLCVFFVLLSLYWFLDLVGPVRENLTKSRVLFAVMAALACLSHYVAFFYVAACMGVAFFSLIVYRPRPFWRSAGLWAAVFAPVLAVMAWLYFTHVSEHAQIQGHLLPYYLLPGAKETVEQFLRRNYKNLLTELGPFPIATRMAYRVSVAVALSSVLAFAVLLRRWREALNARALAILGAGLLVLVQIALMGVLGKYPFGGDLRQQFLLFPFFALAAALLFDRVAALLPPKGGAAFALAVAAAIVAVSAARYVQFPKVGGKLLAPEMAQYTQVAPHPSAVYVDQFNLITYFMHHDDWKWTFVGRDPSVPGIDVYRLTKGPESILLFRDTLRWNIDYSKPDIYPVLARCLQWKNLASLTLFSMSQEPEPFSNAQLKKLVYDYGTAPDLCVERASVTRNGLYGEFRPAGCIGAPVEKPVLSGLFDDRAEQLEYTGAWMVNGFPHAVNGTLSCSKDPRAAVVLPFFGSQVSYIYTKAWNRGLVDVYIDGAKAARIDQHQPGPAIGWQTRTDFGPLKRGWHKIEIRVTGERVKDATDCEVDVDALVVR